MSVVLNFAYGSNMLSTRIAARVPSARSRGAAVLRGHELRWHKAGRDGSAKCDVVRSDVPQAVVHGVVYELLLAERHLLDAAEGLGRGYEQRAVTIESRGEPLAAYLYYATAIDPRLLPFT